MIDLNEFKDVPEWEGLYLINRKGEVYSKYIGGLLKPRRDRSGYVFVTFYAGKRQKTYRIHRLVVKTFLGDRYKGTHVRHKNGVLDDNRIENLSYIVRYNGE